MLLLYCLPAGGEQTCCPVNSRVCPGRSVGPGNPLPGSCFRSAINSGFRLVSSPVFNSNFIPFFSSHFVLSFALHLSIFSCSVFCFVFRFSFYSEGVPFSVRLPVLIQLHVFLGSLFVQIYVLFRLLLSLPHYGFAFKQHYVLRVASGLFRRFIR